MADQDPKPTNGSWADQPTRGWCGWRIFAPQKQTWLGFLLAWACVAAIILLTWLFAQLGG
ncbi:MAG: hypothetical protein JXQ73_30845 [Phycisphaerae bacterium]|nr:hypothetical protein [Phycisphaerae bacterium]